VRRAGEFLRALGATALGLVLPRTCAGCGCGVSGGWWCSDCAGALVRIRPPRCAHCSQPFDGIDSGGAFRCPNCRDRGFHFGAGVSAFRSRGPVRDLIHSLKYHHATWAVGPLGELGREALRDTRLDPAYDAFVPVPLHPLRRRARGYNQSELIARALAAPTKTRVLPALSRVRNTSTQTHFDRKERMQNLRGAFLLRKNAGVSGMHLLLIDDVLTTGSTLDECARVLLAAGAAKVDALAVARG